MPKISALPAGSTPLAGTELVPVVQGGQTVHVPASSLGGGSTPTGTGFRHITAGAEDAAAAKVDPTNAAHMTDNAGAMHGRLPDAKERRRMLDYVARL